MELYSRVRRACHVDGMSERAAGRYFGIDRKTVSKILKHSVPPGYRREGQPARPKLDPFVAIIDQILEEDKSRIKKQRHTAKRIHERLRDEHGFTGGITIVTDYVRERMRRTREVFVPLSHAPGHAQVDFGESLGGIGGVERKLHYFAMSLPHSDAFFIKAYPAETTEAFCDGHNAAFAFFGGVPMSMLYDNTTIAVAKIARHARSYEKADMIFDPMHYLPLLEQKVGALDQAAPLQGWELPNEFATLHRLLEARMGKPGKREYVQVLRLLETFEMAHVVGAIRQALNLGAIGYDAVKHLVFCRIEGRTARLDLDIYPYLPRAQVETTRPASYKVLMSGAAA